VQTDNTTITPAHEIACDESSGWDGANLVAGGSDVIAYASVRLSVDAATECLRELTGRAGPMSREFKASHALPADRPFLLNLLGPAGPIRGHAFLHLTEKAYFVVGRVLGLFLGQSAEAASAGLAADPRLTALATTLSREARKPSAMSCGKLFWVSNAVLRDWKPRNVREPWTR
jgi:hypothetical protein